jgi:kynureninase
MAFSGCARSGSPSWSPTIASWFGARDQFEFRADRFEFRDDAARFELGTPALPTMYTALGGLEIILEAGMERVRARNAALTARPRSTASATPATSCAPPTTRSAAPRS